MKATGGGELYYKENRLKTLRAFCATVEAGSISAAAERLFLSQPTVSLQIKALEKELGTTLFERSGPRLRLTPEGKVFYDMARPLLNDFERLDERFHAQFERLESGELHIAAGETTILHILPEHVKRFSETYPRIRLTLHNVTGRTGMAMLQAGEVDFAVGAMRRVPEGFFFRPVMTFDPMLIVPPGHPLDARENVTLEDVSEYGLILPPRHLATYRLVERVFREHGLKMNVVLETGGWEVVKRYVRLGMGVSIVSGLCLSTEDRLSQIPMRRYFPQRSYGIITRRGKYLSRQARIFINMIDPRYFSEMDRAGQAEET